MTNEIQKLGNRMAEIDKEIAALQREHKIVSDKYVKAIREDYAKARQAAMEKYDIPGVTDWGAA